jgi:type 1 glutamine amidotransferase
MTSKTLAPRLALLACAAALLAPIAASAQTGMPGGAINDNLGQMDYGVCRGTDPKCFHDWPRAPRGKLKVLLYTHTAGPRHANLGPPLGPGLNPPLVEDNAVQRGMVKLAADNGITLDYTEDVAQMQRLSAYNAVIFFSTSRDNLDDGAKTALRQYMRAGGGFVGVHNAFGTLYNWPYYEGLLGGANFYDHGPARDAEVVVVDANDASTKALPKRWRLKDEWYNLAPFPTKVRFLATVDEKTYSAPAGAGEGPPPPRPGEPPRPPRPAMAPSVVGKSPGHGTFHPVAWCQYYDGGKAWLTTLGHDAKLFSATDAEFAGSQAFQTMIVGAIKSVAGEEPFCR